MHNSENLIDFPVSNTFRDYYYERGMMGDVPPVGYRSEEERQMDELRSMMMELTRTLAERAKR